MGLLSGTTNFLSRSLSKRGGTRRLGSWIDKKSYKPYKGYNRLMSQKWNMKHTMK